MKAIVKTSTLAREATSFGVKRVLKLCLLKADSRISTSQAFHPFSSTQPSQVAPVVYGMKAIVKTSTLAREATSFGVKRVLKL